MIVNADESTNIMLTDKRLVDDDGIDGDQNHNDVQNPKRRPKPQTMTKTPNDDQNPKR